MCKLLAYHGCIRLFDAFGILILMVCTFIVTDGKHGRLGFAFHSMNPFMLGAVASADAS
eukprot:m.157313 g.157313  ORF g.157313 m.157313 type:complete len:59 (-) comp15112_c0_seq2:635-811(-)